MRELGSGKKKINFAVLAVLSVLSLLLQRNFLHLNFEAAELACRIQLAISLCFVLFFDWRGVAAQAALNALALVVCVWNFIGKSGSPMQIMDIAFTEFVVLVVKAITAGRNSKILRYIERANREPSSDMDGSSAFAARVAGAIGRIKQGGEFSVLYIDIDNFKSINDSFGSHVGNFFLCEAGQNMLSALDEGEFLARMGGDEFCLLIDHKLKMQELLERISIVMRTLGTPFTYGASRFSCTASMGVAQFPHDGVQAGDLIARANSAMYSAKQSGKARLCFCNQNIQRDFEAYKTVENSVKDAIDNDEFYIEYQPQFMMPEKQLRGLSAIVRWNSPNAGMIPPHEFIQLVEEAGAVHEAGEWILRTACGQYAKIRPNYAVPPVLSVCVSHKQLLDPRFVAEVEEIVGSSGMEFSFLEFDVDGVPQKLREKKEISCLKKFSSMGIKISVRIDSADDGIFSALEGLPLSTVKIGHDLSQSLLDFDSDSAGNFVQRLVEFAGGRNLISVAENVEKAEQMSFFLRYGCKAMQGNFLCKPASVAAL